METECPGCRQPMNAERIDGVVVERCGRCNGLWFDAHELDQAIQRGSRPAGNLLRIESLTVA